MSKKLNVRDLYLFIYSLIFLFVCFFFFFKEAIALLEPMTNDPVNYVRQVRCSS